MSFEQAMKKMKFDTRLLEYNLSQGFITKEEYQKHLAALPDEEINTVKVTLDESQAESEEGSESDAESESLPH